MKNYRIEQINNRFYPQYEYIGFFGNKEWRYYENYADEKVFTFTVDDAKSFLDNKIEEDLPPIYHTYP